MCKRSTSLREEGIAVIKFLMFKYFCSDKERVKLGMSGEEIFVRAPWFFKDALILVTILELVGL